MKNLLLIGLLSIMFTFESEAQKKELKYASDFAQLKKQIKTDSVLRFEYACAKEFHKYINAYRISRKKKPLRWNDTLWVVAMNHGNYLSENNLFGHEEVVGKPLFSGTSPSYRHKFVYKSEYSVPCCGENLYMSFFYDDKSTPEENAHEAFDAWVKSPGHNENMLRESYEEHGAAVVFDEFSMIFTDVFSLGGPISKIKKASDTTPTMTAEEFNKESPQADKGLTSSAFKKLIDQENWAIGILQYFPQSIIQNKHLNAACAKSTQSFLEKKIQDKNLIKQLKRGDEINETEYNIHHPKILEKILGKVQMQESILLMAIQATSVDIKKIKTEIASMIKSHIDKTNNPIKKLGFHLKWKKRGKHFLICASVQSTS